MCYEIVKHIERRQVLVNTKPYGEPQLGKYGLYRSLSTKDRLDDLVKAMLWLLNLCDGDLDLNEVTERSKFSKDIIDRAARKLIEAGILRDTKGDIANGARTDG